MGSNTINSDTIKQLATEVGEDTVSVLLGVFSDELSQYHATLSDSPSIGEIREISHSLKSSASSFGADALADLARECESRVKQGQDDWVIQQLNDYCGLVGAMAKRYRSLAAAENPLNSHF
uniref:Hpt domain-containing protein n=1 Tax=Thaumasiovibrio occultus TaxID=1891184 RepID=UPI000B362D03|nr:Hpt domain-containing protein [Thaumasiovibrio occultus]